MVIGSRRLSTADHERIRTASQEAERRTQIRFALVIVPVSDRYSLYPIVWGALAAFLVAGVLAMAAPHESLRLGFLIEAATFCITSLIFDWMPLRLWLVPGRIKRRHAHALARHEFAAQILAASDHRGGMLFFVSLAEHHVEILVDRELHASIGEGVLNGIVADFVAAAADNRIADGVVAGIKACADILARHSPAPLD
jgi:putative membrane protein